MQQHAPALSTSIEPVVPFDISFEGKVVRTFSLSLGYARATPPSAHVPRLPRRRNFVLLLGVYKNSISNLSGRTGESNKHTGRGLDLKVIM